MEVELMTNEVPKRNEKKDENALEKDYFESTFNKTSLLSGKNRPNMI
jgi:hypothetical protein